MNRDQARKLIGDTFPKAFDKTRFRNFAINLLNHVDEDKAQQWSNQYVKDAFKGHVQRYERLGTYTCPDNEKLDVLIVYLTTESTLERARTAIRNFVADHLKTRDEKEAALVAFVSPTEKQWRFSYVKMEYAAVEKESGKASPEQSRR
ncbi:MAG: class I SAM-dependent DNA methyltransferase, partial [Kiritimatiellae bacterium]|nr:class I SAM-dependent DNA methyltransferase [Kiritimatiellia bacterium]